MPKRPAFAAFDFKAVQRMSENEKLDAVAAILKLLSERTVRIAFASGRQSDGQLSLRQRRAAHRRLFRSALRHIRAIDPALLRKIDPPEEKRTKAPLSRERSKAN